ncbi:hypothetical protein [Flaviaesturariibacter amylovorans]|uniref:DUF349 domain-containing protein n=1 Tax=Flaviaesturariibacter amylovorans TaxID=1084520 RepID=A0ABP8GUJ7_9BACT
MTPTELLQKIEAFETALAAYGVTKFSAKDLWDQRQEIVEDFRSVEFADPGARKDAWQRLQDGIDMLKQRSALLQVENEAFATEAEERIEVLQRRIDDAPADAKPGKEALATLRSAANEIFEFMRQNRWPSKERRTGVWDRFTALKDRIKKQEDAHYARIREDIKQRQERSAALANPLKGALEACRPSGEEGLLLPAVSDLGTALAARGLAFTGFGFVEEALAGGAAVKAPLKLKSDTLRELRRLFQEHRAHFSREDGQEVYTLLTAVQKEMDAAWAAYKGERQRKSDEWVEKQKAFADMLTEKLQKRSADKINLEKIIAAKRDFRPKLEQRLENQQDYLNKLFDDLDELQEKFDGARTPNLRERMEELIESKKGRIAEVEADMKGVEQRIADVDKDITELEAKVVKVGEGIAEMEAKVREVQAKLKKGA